ncbi:hypothetical protein AAVH_34684, partial [Aphelenchoides avenae]
LPEIHHVLDTSVNVTSIFLNGLLIYLVMGHSDFREQTYKWLLLVSGCVDFCLSICALVAQPIFMPSGEYCIVASNGFFNDQSYSFNAVVLTLHYGALHASSIWTAVQFVFRKNLLCTTGSNKKNVVAISVFTAVWAIFGYAVHGFLFAYFDTNDTATALEVLKSNSWPATLAEGGTASPYVFKLENPLWKLFILTWIMSSCLGFTLIIWSEVRIAQHYKTIEDVMRPSTRNLHSEIHRALLAMLWGF